MAVAALLLLAALGSAAAFAPAAAFTPAAAPPRALAGVWVQGSFKARRGDEMKLIMQANRGDNRDKIFPKGRESIERAKKLDEANKDPNQPSLLMREKKFTWPFPFGFLNTLKEENPTVYKAFQLAWFALVVGIAIWPY